MSFEYSSFISYRRNDGNKKYLKKFKKIIESEAKNVTNIDKVFFDTLEIKLGENFDEKIYSSIIKACFFIPLYHMTYLSDENIWCARELYHALEVEKIIHKNINEKYCYILPMVVRGRVDELPECIGAKNAKELERLEYAITSNKTNKKLIKFKQYLYGIFKDNFKLLSDEKGDDLSRLCENMPIPSDGDIKKWILEQNKKNKAIESKKIPILTHNSNANS